MNNIEILEHIAIAYIDDEEFSQYVSPEGRFITNKQLAQALENLIQENKELKEKYLLLNQINDIEKSQHRKSMKELLKDINNNYIPKSKVKEKIEELEEQAEEVKNHYKGTYACLDEYLNAKSKIQGFKELLEEGE